MVKTMYFFCLILDKKSVLQVATIDKDLNVCYNVVASLETFGSSLG